MNIHLYYYKKGRMSVLHILSRDNMSISKIYFFPLDHIYCFTVQVNGKKIIHWEMRTQILEHSLEERKDI